MSGEINLASHLIKVRDILKSYFKDFKFSGILVDKDGSHLTLTWIRNQSFLLDVSIRIIPRNCSLRDDPSEWYLLVETKSWYYNEYSVIEYKNNDLKLVSFKEPDLRLTIQTIQRSILGAKVNNPHPELIDALDEFLLKSPEEILVIEVE